ncbi:thioesterase [Pseudofulvibacter geojedonensis]|uniref:Thioesterase n=1 Tax=Pseudofulvibacter geojedonensis TaxID=1123758 RepID=A0ABW3I6B1_9FLAO
MKISPRKINLFLLAKLPSAFLCGVRLKSISNAICVTSVKYRWINQNPFNSLYFAVQAMASELSTGALVLKKIQESGNKISMLVTHNTGSYSKKAVGRITFTCSDGDLINDAIKKAIETKEGQKITLTSVGIDNEGDEVGKYTYEWSIKAK